MNEKAATPLVQFIAAALHQLSANYVRNENLKNRTFNRVCLGCILIYEKERWDEISIEIVR